ncbi:AAA family ATPase [Modestobacter sp. I12A-02628]|uniref:ATP-binding protein n=1 Tax=Goekera deserti TaxID=2497753 RepID=A0A7K3WIM9_9ACTN|nr:AAA family ATPase [Goekera deserti]NDI46609.1 AAA family ATPase [Goekera deserti]NEL56365.1 ATP-binding protein [Goekera deserti]
MIVWLDGAFGAGKTTVADELHRRLPDAMPFDPELVGYVLHRSVPRAPSGDFQDLPLWRALVAEFALGLRREYGRPLVVPMTLVDPVVREDVFGRLQAAGEHLLHVFLDVDAEELRRRVQAQVVVAHDAAADASARAFRLAAVDRCVAARAHVPAGTLVLDGRLPTAELADRVLAVLG